MRKITKFIIFTIFCLTGMFISCKDVFNNSSESFSKGIIVKGTIDSESSRYAYPTNIDTNVDYTIVAVQNSKTVNGTITNNESTKNYTISLPNGGIWIIKASKIHEGKVILADSKRTANLPESATTISINFNLRPVYENTGVVDLPITVDSSIKSVDLICNDDDWNAETVLNGTTVTIKSSSMKSKEYNIELYFYSSTTEKNISTLLFNTSQNVRVCDYLTTNSWDSYGGELHINWQEGKMNITKEVIENFIQSVQYVDGNNRAENQTGTWISPFSTVSVAASVLNNKTYGGTIYVKNEVNENKTIVIDKTIYIKQWPGENNATIKRGMNNSTPLYNQSMIEVKSGAVLDISNITLDGNNVEAGKDDKGAGIYTEGFLAIKDSKILNCKTSNSGYGGGIYANDATPANWVSINNTQISGCTSGNGGGIYLNRGTLNLENGSIIGSSSASANADGTHYSNKAFEKGGGIMTNSGSTLSITGANTSVSYNYSQNEGGGIYSNGKLEMQNGKIIYNASGNDGKGIYDNGELIFDVTSNRDNPEINQNNDIFVNAGKTIRVKGVIGSNSAGTPYSPTNPFAIISVSSSGSGSQLLDNSSAYNVADNFTKFNITQEEYSVNKTGKVVVPVFVSGENSVLPAGNDSNTGYKTSPVATLSKAIDLIKDDSSREGIFISGTVLFSDSPRYDKTEMLEVSKYGNTAELKRNSINSQIEIENGSITFNNITFNGNKLASKTTGIYVSSGNVIFSECTVKNFYFADGTETGSAFRINNSGAKVELRDTDVRDCTGSGTYGVIYVGELGAVLNITSGSYIQNKIVIKNKLIVNSSTLDDVDVYGTNDKRTLVEISGSGTVNLVFKDRYCRIIPQDKLPTINLTPHAYPTRGGSSIQVCSSKFDNVSCVKINDNNGLQWKVNSNGVIDTNLPGVISKDSTSNYPLIQVRLNTSVGRTPGHGSWSLGYIKKEDGDWKLPDMSTSYFNDVAKEIANQQQSDPTFYLISGGTIKYGTYVSDGPVVPKSCYDGVAAWYYQVRTF